jgi:hypothetical protein
MIRSIMLTMPREKEAKEGKDKDNTVMEMCSYFLEKLPAQIRLVEDVS